MVAVFALRSLSGVTLRVPSPPPQELSAVVLSAPFRDNQVRGLVEAALMDIDKQMSGCETLIRSPMPLFYTQARQRDVGKSQ